MGGHEPSICVYAKTKHSLVGFTSSRLGLPLFLRLLFFPFWDWSVFALLERSLHGLLYCGADTCFEVVALPALEFKPSHDMRQGFVKPADKLHDIIARLATPNPNYQIIWLSSVLVWTSRW